MNVDDKEQGLWGHCSCGAVKRASRRLSQLYDEMLEPSGLRSTQYTLLTQILIAGEPSLRQLAGALVMDLSALGHTLRPLIRDGLVALRPDLSDRRVKRAILTALGRARQREAQSLWRVAQGRIDDLLGAAEADDMRRMLNAVSSPEFAEQFRGGATDGDGRTPPRGDEA
jgi:DNA-binding MarR family transcriptional regulator